MHLFFDDGGVLNDNSIRSEKWKELIADWYQPRFGGERVKWKEANTHVIEKEIKFYSNVNNNHSFSKIRQDLDMYWMKYTFEYVGVSLPQNPLKIKTDAEKWIIPQAIAPYDGIIEVIKSLHTIGKFHTASNETYSELHYYLKGMGIREYFDDNLFGTDLVDKFKSDSDYYESIFAKTNIEPSSAVIIEDKPKIIDLIEQAGATAIQSVFSEEFDKCTEYVISTPSDLPKILNKIMNK